MASTAIRERRRTLRYGNLLERQMVQMKIKISALLMAAGVSYNKQRLHKAGYFRELLASNPDIDEGRCSLLRLCRETVVRLGKTESALVRCLLARLAVGGTCGAVDDYSCRRADHGVDLGAGSGRCPAVLIDQESRQLLRMVWRGEPFGGVGEAHAAVPATQQAFADHADRSGQDGAAQQPGAGHAG